MIDILSEHQTLFSGSGLMLGRILEMLLRSEYEMDELKYGTVTEQSSVLANRLPQRSLFGQEVGRNEIHWWVHKREPNVRELLCQTHQTLESVQRLRRASANLKYRTLNLYSELVDLIVQFIEVHKEQIGVLHEFVLWLQTRDSLAPSIMFSYSVWGTTRRTASKDRTTRFDRRRRP